MPVRVKKLHPALKHAAYSATSVLPGESAAEFEKLHRDLIAELAPNGALDDDIVATMTCLVWRKQNLATFRIAALAKRRCDNLMNEKVPRVDFRSPEYAVDPAAREEGIRSFDPIYQVINFCD